MRGDGERDVGFVVGLDSFVAGSALDGEALDATFRGCRARRLWIFQTL